MNRRFLSPEAFGLPGDGYSLLPFRFRRLTEDREILISECGEYQIVPRGTVRTLVERRLDTRSALYADLCAKQIIADKQHGTDLELLATKYRTKREFMWGSTRLHIFVVTLRCDHSCVYCQVSRQSTNADRFDMSAATAERALDVMMQSPGSDLTLEIQGGEATLAVGLVRQLVSNAKAKAAALGKDLNIVLTSNLAHLTDELLEYLRSERIKVSTSLDGPAFIHNRNRPRPGGNAYELAVEGIRRCREALGEGQVSALMTTTLGSLEHPCEIIDEYVRQSLHSIFLRPISPYGFAVKTRRKVGYETARFLEFYKTGLHHIIDLNRRGYRLVEVYTKLLLTKILTPYGTGYVDLQSPAGAGFGALVYNYNGDVYVSDEGRMLAEMGDFGMRIGNVHADSRRELLRSPQFLNMVEAWCNEGLPGCSDCAFQPYCGADPTFHYATQGDCIGHRPTSGFCERNMSVLSYLFELIAQDDPETMRILWSWIADRPDAGSEP